MREYNLVHEQWIDQPLELVFDFFADAANLALITPAWLGFEILTPRPITLCPGALIDYRLRWHSVPIGWQTEIVEWDPPRRFVDVQRRGPYALWHHTHTFEPRDGGTHMRDQVRYALPFGVLGRLAHRLKVQRDLQAIFDYRAAQVARLLPAAHGPSAPH